MGNAESAAVEVKPNPYSTTYKPTTITSKSSSQNIGIPTTITSKSSSQNIGIPTTITSTSSSQNLGIPTTITSTSSSQNLGINVPKYQTIYNPENPNFGSVIYKHNMISNETQSNFDPVRYTGTWYEVARYINMPKPISFEEGCTSVSAEYAWDSTDNLMTITNNCYKNNDLFSYITGTARIPDLKDKSKLLVKFNKYEYEYRYWVHWTDYDNYAIVGEPRGNNLWILSRTPVLKRCDIDNLIKKIKYFGYNPNRLQSYANVLVKCEGDVIVDIPPPHTHSHSHTITVS
jgi:apolipoprotein D and lipocalin family protein